MSKLQNKVSISGLEPKVSSSPAPAPKLKNSRIGTKICVVVDIDHVIMIVVTKRQKVKKDKNTKGQKDKKTKKTKRQKRQKKR